MSTEEIKSPCVSICALDENDICMGCYRSADEITDWFMATDEQKHELLRVARKRRQASTSIQLL
ncbi:MAG: DUF1289 domain-containing protein [Halioglobus sp.]|nr:DUF1289 domain-containing protein [Halioglobus sp.]